MAMWGLHFVVIRIGALEIPPLFLLSIRFGLCALIFLPLAKRLSLVQYKKLALYVLPFQVIHMATLFLGLAEVDAGLASLIIQVEFPFLILIGLIFYNERFGPITALGLLITLIGGAILVYTPGENANITPMGVTYLVISALGWAIGSARLKYIQEMNFPTMVGNAFGMAFPVILILTLTLESNHIEALKSADHVTLGAVLFFQVIIISACHYGWMVLIGRNPVYKLTAMNILAPIFAVIFAVLILGEVQSLTTLLGGALALIGIAIVTFRKAKKTEPPVEGIARHAPDI